MRFPFSFRFERELTTTVTAENEHRIVKYIEARITKLKANNVFIESSCVNFKGSTGGRGSLFLLVDHGVFALLRIDGIWNLTYQIDMPRLFIETGIICAVLEAFALLNNGLWWFGLFAYLWLCGVNWAIALIRNGSFATELAADIDEIIDDKAAIED